MQQRSVAYAPDRRGARNAAAFHALVAMGCFVFAAVAWSLTEPLVRGTGATRLAVVAVGLTGFALFGWIGFRFWERQASDAPLFVLDPKGLFDNGSGVFTGVGWIPWNEIEDVRVGRYHNLPCVELVLVDRAAFLERLSWIERVGRSARLGYPAVAFRGPLLPDDPERIVDEIRGYVRSLAGEG